MYGGSAFHSIGNSAAGIGTERPGLSAARFFTDGARMQRSAGLIGETLT